MVFVNIIFFHAYKAKISLLKGEKYFKVGLRVIISAHRCFGRYTDGVAVT